MNVIYMDTFSSAENLRGKQRTYEAVKECVLKAGRFSVFEATDNQSDAALFTRLCRDPEIETFDLGFPWKGVRKRAGAASGGGIMSKVRWIPEEPTYETVEIHPLPETKLADLIRVLRAKGKRLYIKLEPKEEAK